MSKREQFAETMLSVMKDNANVVVLLGDIGVFSFRRHAEKWPSRIINIGICEQTMVSLGAGLSLSGLYPVISTIDAFLVRRAYEQVMVDFGFQGLPGLFVTVGGVNDYAKLGETHQCPEGPILMGRIPHMTCFYPTEGNVAPFIEGAVAERLLAYMSLEEGHA